MPQVTISKVMLEHAALAVETARTQFRINLDFSATSLSEVDRILSALYFNRDRGLVAKLLNKSQEHEIREQAKTWGGYVGETLRRKWGGTWHTTVLPGGEIQIYLKLFGSNAYPIDEVYKRLVHGPQQHSLLGLHEIALANANPAAMNAPKGHGTTPTVIAGTKPQAAVAAPSPVARPPQIAESSVDI